jgi:hypothetical protein
MADNPNLDDELRRLLDSISRQSDLPVELQQFKQTQSSMWPWQVPQAPAYTSDHTPA